MSKEKFNKILRDKGFKFIVDNPQQVLGKDEQIEIILEKFDFERVHQAMTHLNWTWANSATIPNSVPSVDDIKKSARRYLERMWEYPLNGGNPQINCTGSGGIEATRYVWDGLKILSLQFVLSEWFFDYEEVQHTLERYLGENEAIRMREKINLKNNQENT